MTELVAEKSGWATQEVWRGRGFGLAAHWSFLSYVAAVVEVEVDERGDVTIPRVDIAVDAGTIVNPDRVVAQFEGAAVFGTSLALMGQMTAIGGRIQQSNFDSYPVARINQAPRETHVHIVPSRAAHGTESVSRTYRRWLPDRKRFCGDRYLASGTARSPPN